jgi:hypothetical protein
VTTRPPTPQLLERIRAEYLEMPGLRLRAEQVQRLCGVERTMCRILLDALVETNFLWMKSDGSYARLMDGEKLSVFKTYGPPGDDFFKTFPPLS